MTTRREQPPERRRAGRRLPIGLASTLATWFGRDPGRFHRSAACRQCGTWSRVNVLRLGRRRARLWCQHCGAVATLTDLSGLRPVRDLRAGRAAGASDPARQNPADVVEPALREVMPAAMLAWLAAREPATTATLNRRAVNRLYRDWDAYLREAATGSRVAGDLPPVAGLPAFSTVIGTLDDLCYHTGLAVEILRASAPAGQAAEAALWERVEHARRWLATAESQCWLRAGVPGAELAEPAVRQVAAAVAALHAGRELDVELALAARAAMFGTHGGPPLPVLQQVYPPEVMLDALRAYLDSGARPLRDDALARLAAPPQPAPERAGGAAPATRREEVS